MDIKDIKRIIALMKSNELTEFEMEDQGFRIAIKRGNGQDGPMVVTSPAPIMMSAPSAVAAVPAAAPVAVAAEAAAQVEDDGFEEIKSPIVGTFYRSATPEADSFVSVGDTVEEDTVVCIIEAMKVMNEIKAETSGVIKKILVENATAVEFGQPLFKVDPA